MLAEGTLCRCHARAGCASRRTRAGVEGRACQLQPNLNNTNCTSDSQYTMSELTTSSPSVIDYHSPTKYRVDIAYLETLPRKPRTNAYSTRHDSRRFRHWSLQVVLKDNGCVHDMSMYDRKCFPAAIYLRPILSPGSNTCSALSVALSAEEP